MRRLVSLLAALAVASPALAQAPPVKQDDTELKTRTFSWSDALDTRGNAGPEQVKTNISSTPARQRWIDTFADWLRKSYTPVGALPQMFRNIDPYRTGLKSRQPVTYGYSMVMQDPTYKAGKIVRSPIPSLAIVYTYANQIPGAESAWEFNTPDTWYFTMWVEPDGTWVVPSERAKLDAEVAEVKRIVGRPAAVYINTGFIYVVLTRDGRLPVTPVTVGEAMNIAEAGMLRRQAGGDAVTPGTHAAQMRGLAQMRARHAHELSRPARISTLQYSSGVYDSPYDVFGPGDKGLSYPLYKLDPQVYAKAAAEGPQWLAIGFPRLGPGAKARERAIHEAMIRRFNYAYAWDTVFAPEKVKGVPYTPR